MSSIQELQTRIHDVLRAEMYTAPEMGESSEPEGSTPPRRFSGFHLPDTQRAKELAAEWMQRAEETRGTPGSSMVEAVDSALEAASHTVTAMESAADEDADLARYALKLFLTHYRHELPLRIPGLEARAPWLILPSRNGAGEKAEGPEERLRWFREDPKLNEHHEHWHVVYPICGVPDPDSPRHGKTKERQGELFLYMHRQMQARYEAERLAVGLDRLVPWSYRDVEPWGYDPGPYLKPAFGARPPGRKWETTPEPVPGVPEPLMVSVEDMATRGERLFKAAESGYFELPGEPPVPVDIDLLGKTQEADIGTVQNTVMPWDPDKFREWYTALIGGYYGNFHAVGHDMFSYLSSNHIGVMGFQPTSIRDHVFFRWHKLIDDLYFTWQETQPSHDFSKDIPPVKIRKGVPGKPEAPNRSPDIILCLKSELVPWDHWEEFGALAFGADSWDTEFASGSFEHAGVPTEFTTTDELLTEMRRRVVTVGTTRKAPIEPEQAHEIEYLDQRDFFYFFRLENESDETQDVTVRVFMAPLDPPATAEDRRMWIEMDKFRRTLQARERSVVFRPASASSVIRKPAVKPPSAQQRAVGEALPDALQEDADLAGNYCDCGWPYNLLLPRGRKEGMRFRILVMLTDWNLDHVEEEGNCGSMSYCGARDKYPDRRPMGYPFDAPFRERSIAETIAAAPNMATRDISIRWL